MNEDYLKFIAEGRRRELRRRRKAFWVWFAAGALVGLMYLATFYFG